MTNEERIVEMQMIALRLNAPSGQRSCQKCRWKKGPFKGELAECSNPIVVAKHGSSKYIDIYGIRTRNGICGPDALLWERRWWWPFKRLLHMA